MNTTHKQHSPSKLLIFLSIFLLSYLVVALAVTVSDRRYSLNSPSYAAWERAPSWMWPLSLMWPSEQRPARSLKLSSFVIPSPTPTVPTSFPEPTAFLTPGAVITPAIGGPNPPDGYYCIDDEDPDGCDDATSHFVPKGAGGISGTCGSVIGQAHKLVASLPQEIKYNETNGEGQPRDRLNYAVSHCNYSTGPQASGYISTLFVIDAYNLAGFPELNKSNPAQVSPSGLLDWWKTQPAGSGYEYIPYTTAVVQQYGGGQKDLTGCVMFLDTGSGYHIGIVNALELYTPGGDGVISILQSGTRMYIDRFPVSGWAISGNSTNMTNTNGVTGFGCHT